MDFEFSAEDLGLNPNAGKSNSYEKLVPSTSFDEATKTLTITGWVTEKVDLIDYTFEKGNAIFTFEGEFDKKNQDGSFTPTIGTIRKYISDPVDRPYISRLEDEDPKKKQLIGYVYKELLSLFKNFLKPYVVDNIASTVKPVTLESLSTALFDGLVNATEKELNTTPVALKLAFQHASGVEPKYIVPNNRYIGNEKYPPIWTDNSKDEKYNDNVTFVYEEETESFATPPSAPMDMGDINDVFGESTPPINVPNVDLM